MASYRKKGNGWVAEIFKLGTRKSRSFTTKAEAIAWATHEESNLMAGKKGQIPDKPLSWLLEKYAAEVSPSKKSQRWEEKRLIALGNMQIGRIMLPDLRPVDITAWRDERLKNVSAATVNRDWNLLSNVFTVAIDEWEVLKEHPMKKVKRPPASIARNRLISEDEIERILFACGYEYDKPPQTAQARVGAAFLFAIETAMRKSEIISLKPNSIHLDKRTAKLTDTKNGTNRDVPLSPEAIRILRQLPPDTTCFGLTSDILDALFRKAKSRTLIEDLHFHDSRHEAITRLSKKLGVLELARMVGHKDLRQLMVYYNETAEELAKKLD